MSFFKPIRPLFFGCLLSFAGWSLVGLAMATQGVVARGDPWSAHLAPSLRTWLPWAVVTPLIFRLVARLPIDRERWKLALPMHVAIGFCIVLSIHSWRDHLAPIIFSGGGVPRSGGDGRRDRGYEGPRGRGQPSGERSGRRAGGRDPRDRGFFDLLGLVTREVPIYLMIFAGAHALLFYRRNQEAAAHLARAQLDVLRMQLQPHFLFNSLNTISNLVHEDPHKAEKLIGSLSGLLRSCLDSAERHEVPLADEVEFVASYLSLMHARFEDRLRYEIDVPADLRSALVPTMLLQPLVENAVEHGLRPKPGGGTINVRAARNGDRLRIEVSDNGIGIDDQIKEGIGIGTTRRRLENRYGQRANLSFERHLGITTAVITLPDTSTQ